MQDHEIFREFMACDIAARRAAVLAEQAEKDLADARAALADATRRREAADAAVAEQLAVTKGQRPADAVATIQEFLRCL